MSKHVRLDVLEELERQVRNSVKYAREKAVDVPSFVLEPHDGGPALRPHGTDGKLGWQVWSGGICIALLSHEDVAPVLAAQRQSKDGQE